MKDHEPDGTAAPAAAPAPAAYAVALAGASYGGDASDRASSPVPASARREHAPATGPNHRARAAATVPAQDVFMLRLQSLEAIGAHDEAFALASEGIRGEDRLIAKAEARRAELLAFVHEATTIRAREQHPGNDEALVWAMRERTAELALATGRSEPVVSRELGESLLLREAFPATEGAFREGRLSLAHVRVILAEGRRLPDDQARAAYERSVAQPVRGETPARLRARARRAAQGLMRESLDERHRAAREQRGVRLVHEDDGMSRLEAIVPSVLGAAMLDRLTAQAKALSGPDEPRTCDQLRADLLCELVLTTDPANGSGSPHGAAGGIRARVAITVPVLSLLGRDDAPALLDGVVPVPVEQARELASRAPSFLRVLTDPITGVARESDTRLPTSAQREFLRIRDGHCRFPGCTRPARRCDVDHTIAVADGGPTSLGNLEHLCRRHHTLKHGTRWRVTQHEPGQLIWSAPSGGSYLDRPTPIGPRFHATDRPPRYATDDVPGDATGDATGGATYGGTVEHPGTPEPDTHSGAPAVRSIAGHGKAAVLALVGDTPFDSTATATAHAHDTERRCGPVGGDGVRPGSATATGVGYHRAPRADTTGTVAFVRALDTSERSVAPTVRAISEQPRVSSEPGCVVASTRRKSIDPLPVTPRRSESRGAPSSRSGTDADTGDPNDPPPL